MIKVSSDISRILPYVPGKPVEELEREFGISGAVKMASNENPLGPSRKALSAIRRHLKDIGQYPNGAAWHLKEALADKWKVHPEQVLIGNGSNEIIELLIRTFIMPGDEVIMAQPTFSLYRLMAQTGHSKSIRILLRNGKHDLDKMAEAVTARTKLIFICNPNNPTGTIVHHKAVRKFLSSIPKRILVVFDEAYAEYATHTEFPHSVSLLKEGGPLIMLRTFSKIYGLAGLRIGYGISHRKVIGYMNRVRQPFNVNLPGQQGALAALSDDDHLSRSRKVNLEGKQYLTRRFDELGIFYFPSETNFVYFYFQKHDPEFGERVQDGLLKKGVIVRYFDGSHFRVTIGLQGENRRFIQALKTLLSTIKTKEVIPIS